MCLYHRNELRSPLLGTMPSNVRGMNCEDLLTVAGKAPPKEPYLENNVVMFLRKLKR